MVDVSVNLVASPAHSGRAGYWAASISATASGAVAYDVQLSPDLSDADQSALFVGRVWSIDQLAGWSSDQTEGRIEWNTGMRAGIGSEGALMRHLLSSRGSSDSAGSYPVFFGDGTTVRTVTYWPLPSVWYPTGKLQNWTPQRFLITIRWLHGTATSFTCHMTGRWGEKGYGLPSLDGVGDPAVTAMFV